MSETWEELGIRGKISPDPEKKEKDLSEEAPPVKDIEVPKPAKHLTHESEDVTERRRARAMEAISLIDPNAEKKENGLVVATVEGRKIDFYPSTGCYLSHASNTFGHGIEDFCEKILRWRLNKEKNVSRETIREGEVNG